MAGVWRIVNVTSSGRRVFFEMTDYRQTGGAKSRRKLFGRERDFNMFKIVGLFTFYNTKYKNKGES